MSRPDRIEPGPRQESVWDYPRPPRVDPSSEHVRVELDGVVLAESRRAFRVLETSQPPAYYLPGDDADLDRFLLEPDLHTFCEWKGHATYWSVRGDDRVVERAAWSYPQPTPAFAAIRDHFAFYPRLVDCFVDGERVQGNEGDFYGGWITSRVVGPFKGAPGTGHW